MKLPNIKGFVGLGKAVVAANRPEILFGTSMVTTVAAVVAAARGGYKSGQQVLQAELDVTDEELTALKKQSLEKKDIAKLTWLNYLPAAGLTGGALGATTGLHLVHVKEKKQLAAIAVLAIEEGKKEAAKYKQEVLETVGLSTSEDPKELDKAAKKAGVAKVVHSDGELEELYLVRDRKTGRDIYSNRTRIEEAMIDLNNQLIHGEAIDLNSFYGYAGFASVPEGDDYGWEGGERVEVTWLNNEVRDDGRPVRVFSFRPEPKENYDSGH